MDKESVISPLLFSIMLSVVCYNAGGAIGRYLCTDDGGLWKRGRNVQYVVEQLKEWQQSRSTTVFIWQGVEKDKLIQFFWSVG